MNPIPYTLTSESVVVVVGGKPYTFQKGTPNYEGIRKALFDEDWAAIPKMLTVASSIEQWAKGNFTVVNGILHYKEQPIPSDMNARILDMAAKGEDPTPLFKFYERLQKNPSWRSVQQLWPFLSHRGIPIDEEGYFLAYKAVKSNFMDCHTGTVDNHVGTKHTMERNLVSDDPDTACHYGFHVGALEYARSFGDSDRNIIICKVDPADVVCVPKDCSQQKMRVCAYEVIGHHVGGYLPSTTFKEELEEKEGSCYEDASGCEEEPEEDEDDLEEGEEGSCYGEDERPRPKAPKAPKEAPKPKAPIDSNLFVEMDKEDSTALLARDIATLRRYAALHLKIVGASKLLGGKTMLVNRILTIRSKG